VKLLVDVNAFIDVLTKQMNWEGSLRVLHRVRQSPEIEGGISALTIPLLYFFRLRVAAEEQARIDAQACVQGFRLVPLTQEIIAHALASVLPDFEDNIPRGSAATIAAPHVITHNQRHFQPTQVSVVNPEEWLARETGSRIEAGLATASC
jgi:hypothetical protein